MHKVMNHLRERTGIYGGGFRVDSAFGVFLPFAIVILVGGFGALLVYLLN